MTILQKKNSSLLWISLIIVILLAGVGVYYLTRPKPTESPQNPSEKVRQNAIKAVKAHWKSNSNDRTETGTVNGQKITEVLGVNWENEFNDKSDQSAVDSKKTELINKINGEKSKETPPSPPETEEDKAKKKMLGKYENYFSEQDPLSLISQIPYLGANYSSSTVEEIANRNWEIFKSKKIDLFVQLPTNTQEFEDQYKKAEKTKVKFLFVSLIPRKSDGKVDWIKWQEQEENEEKLFKASEFKNYFQNKINPTLKDWYDNLKSDPDPVKRLNLLNQQLEEHLNTQLVAWQLHKIGKEKGWIDKQYYKSSQKCSYKDASGNQVKIDFDLVLEFDLSKWTV